MPKYLDYHGLETLVGDIAANYIKLSQKASANGVASLDSTGKVPISQLPAASGSGLATLGSNGKVPNSQLPIGSASGIAGLDSSGKVPASQLPSYVDDVLEYAAQSSFPSPGEGGKIYVAKDTNKIYRWSGSAYIEISTAKDPTSIISDTAGDGATDKVWSANKTYDSLAGKADKVNTVLDTTLSRGRQNGTTVGTGSFAFGNNVIASGQYSHAEGSDWASGNATHMQMASGNYSHAEGHGSTASGVSAHAEGSLNLASGQDSHAEGQGNTASGTQSHAEGEYTIAKHKSQHVFGEYNTGDPSTAQATARGNFIEIVGNGTSANARSTARTLDWNGNERVLGDVYVGCSADGTGGKKVATAENPVFTGSISLSRKYGTTVGSNSFAHGTNTTASSYDSHAEGEETVASGWHSHAEGRYTIAAGSEQHASGRWNVSDLNSTFAEIVGNGYAEIDEETFVITEHRSNARALDWQGNEYLAGDLYVGCNADSSGGAKVLTSANPVFTGSISLDRYGNVGSGSVAVGSGTEASGNQSFSEGRGTAATGTVSHAAGEGTKATHKAQHVFGMYNEEDPSTAAGTAKGTYIEIVGNGTDATSSKRSNARTLDWSGNESLAGSITLGKGTADEVTLTAAQVKQLLALLN